MGELSSLLAYRATSLRSFAPNRPVRGAGRSDLKSVGKAEDKSKRRRRAVAAVDPSQRERREEMRGKGGRGEGAEGGRHRPAGEAAMARLHRQEDSAGRARNPRARRGRPER